MKSIYVHFLNKFPGARVEMGERHVAAYCQSSGELLMRAELNGLGVMVDSGSELGARHALCLSPIPKEARHMKLFKDGRVGRAEEHAVRGPKAKEIAAVHGYVPSEIQLKHARKDGEKTVLATPDEALAAEKGL